MKTSQNDYWDKLYIDPELVFPQYDGYLDQFLDEIRHASRIVDLGCGNGVNTVYLNTLGICTIACDISEPALNLLHKNAPNSICLLFDMTAGLPFPKNSIDVIIADLSLHYFSEKITRTVIDDIHRVLRPGGLFLCRVNSTKEYQKQNNGYQLEDSFYEIDGCTKRFFSKASLSNYLYNFEIADISEKVTEKYGNEKIVIEGVARK